jgi:hypothetical protein
MLINDEEAIFVNDDSIGLFAGAGIVAGRAQLKNMADSSLAAAGAPDWREGVTAFAEKRPPRFAMGGVREDRARIP